MGKIRQQRYQGVQSVSGLKRATFFWQFHPFAIIFAPLNVIAQVAKLVDALCSGRSVRKDVLVRIQSWAPLKYKTPTNDYL